MIHINLFTFYSNYDFSDTGIHNLLSFVPTGPYVTLQKRGSELLEGLFIFNGAMIKISDLV